MNIKAGIKRSCKRREDGTITYVKKCWKNDRGKFGERLNIAWGYELFSFFEIDN